MPTAVSDTFAPSRSIGRARARGLFGEPVAEDFRARCDFCFGPRLAEAPRTNRPDDGQGRSVWAATVRTTGTWRPLRPTSLLLASVPTRSATSGAAAVHGGFARHERDVRHDAGKPVPLGRLEVRE